MKAEDVKSMQKSLLGMLSAFCSLFSVVTSILNC